MEFVSLSQHPFSTPHEVAPFELTLQWGWLAYHNASSMLFPTPEAICLVGLVCVTLTAPRFMTVEFSYWYLVTPNLPSLLSRWIKTGWVGDVSLVTTAWVLHN